MLRRLSSQTPSFGGLRERECPRCHAEVTLPLGAICGECRRDVTRRAARVARWVSLVTTLGFGAYVMLRMPQEQTARLVGGMAVVMWYVVSRLITLRIARVWFAEHGRR